MAAIVMEQLSRGRFNEGVRGKTSRYVYDVLSACSGGDWRLNLDGCGVTTMWSQGLFAVHRNEGKDPPTGRRGAAYARTPLTVVASNNGVHNMRKRIGGAKRVWIIGSYKKKINKIIIGKTKYADAIHLRRKVAGLI